MQHLPPNTTLQGGKYRIERVLGQGGFGITYQAVQVSLNRIVAIKELFLGGVGQAINDRHGNMVVVSNNVNQQSFDQQRDKFKKEALRLAQLNHPNLVKVNELFEENGTAYFVMDYIEGESLRTKMNRDGKLPEKVVLKYLQQIISALEHAHSRNIWHLDIKPENIMVDKYEHVYLIDFGASKHIEKNNTLTTSLALAYTPGYSPPELTDLSNENRNGIACALKEIGPWTDIYALGATMYNLLTDSMPPSSSRLYRDDRNAFMFPDNLSISTQNLIVWMMKPNREERPQSIDAIIEVEKSRRDETKPDHKSTLCNDKEETVIAQPQSGEKEKGSGSYFEGESHPSDKSASPTNIGDWEGSKGCIYALFISSVLVALLFFIINIAGGSKEEPRKIHAAGISWNSPLGSCRYSGYIDTWDAFNPHGTGEVHFNDGRYYRGGFCHGVFTGKNTLYRYPNGDSFEGEFRNNAFYYGVYRLKEDNSYYCGPFVKDERNQQEGAWYDENGKKLKKERKSLVNIKGIEMKGYKRSQN